MEATQVKAKALRGLALERFLAALLVGLVLFLVSYALDLFMERMGVVAAETLVNNFVIAICGALAAYLWARFEAEKQARAREKMILIVELNHHIRNAFNLISQSSVVPDERERLLLIDSAIERVDRVLTELVPTVGEAASPRLFFE